MTVALTTDSTLTMRVALIRRMAWFNLRPLAYAHPDWWPEAVRTYLGDAANGNFSRIDIEESDLVRDGSRLWLSSRAQASPEAKGASAKVIKRDGYWKFEDWVEKVFLLPPSRFNEIVVDVGLSMHRAALLGVLSGSVLRVANELFGNDRVDFVLSQTESVVDTLPASFAFLPERDFSSLDASSNQDRTAFARAIESDGARSLLEAVAEVSPGFAWRAKLRWPSTWSNSPLQMKRKEARELRQRLQEFVLQPKLAEDAWLS